MATYTTNYNLKKPESTDPFGDFRSDYNDNLDIIDANLGGGGGSGDTVTWTQVQSSGTKIAEIDINGTTQDVYAPTGGGGGGHTYSTSEQVVGTWLGETLYERSFVYTGNIANGAWVTVDNSYSPNNIGVMFVEHICFKLQGFTTLYASYGGQTLDVGIETAGKLYLENFTGETVTKAWFTIRYTKTA